MEIQVKKKDSTSRTLTGFTLRSSFAVSDSRFTALNAPGNLKPKNVGYKMYEVDTCTKYLLSNEYNTLTSAQLLERNRKFQRIFMSTSHVVKTSHFAVNTHDLKKSIRFWSKMA